MPRPIQDRQNFQEQPSWPTRNRQRRWEWEAGRKLQRLHQLGVDEGLMQGGETNGMLSSKSIRGSEFNSSTFTLVDGTGLHTIHSYSTSNPSGTMLSVHAPGQMCTGDKWLWRLLWHCGKLRLSVCVGLHEGGNNQKQF